MDGHPEGAQALAANLLDTMLRETLDKSSFGQVTNQRDRLSIDDLPLRAAAVFGGIWGSHTEFRSWRGDAIPRGFSRHGSVHAVSQIQYSRINALIALMHVTSYIMLLDSGDMNVGLTPGSAVNCEPSTTRSRTSIGMSVEDERNSVR